jgi:cyanophycin synthetase
MPDARIPLRWKLLRIARRLGLPVKQRLRVPSAFVTGSVGKTTTCRMTAAILAAAGKTVGLTTTTGCFVDGQPLRLGDCSSPRWAALVTADRRVDAAVLEMARGGILLDGMPFRGCDVGAVLTVLDDHLGLDGIHTREQLAKVKSIVAVSAQRLAVLNADDPLVLPMREVTPAREVCLVSRRPDASAVVAHLARGGLAALLDPEPHGLGGTLRLRRGASETFSLPAADIPATFGGRFVPAAVNAVFAMAISHGMGVDSSVIRAALRAFHSDESDNPGRMNLHHGMPYTLVATKAGGVAAAQAIAGFAREYDVPGRRKLVVCSVGNRPEDVLRSVGGAYAGAFDSYICCDWEDRRGRPRGEAAGLLAAGLREAGVPEHAIEIVPDHDAAIRRAHAAVVTDDLLVVASPTAAKAPGILRSVAAA